MLGSFLILIVQRVSKHLMAKGIIWDSRMMNNVNTNKQLSAMIQPYH